MDKRNSLFKLKEMLKETPKKILTLYELKSLIMTHIGSQEKTIDSSLRIMGAAGLIKDVGDSRFEILKSKD